MILRAALVDMDGTIWESPLRMAALRQELGLPQDGRPILHAIADLPRGERERATQALQDHEAHAVDRGALRPGTTELLRFLRRRNLRCALITNNSRRSVDLVLARHPLPFDLVFTRDDGPLKPDPQAFLLPLARLGVPPEEAIAIGDSHFDLQAAVGAGIREVILVQPAEWMRGFFPPGARPREVPTLREAQALIVSLLDGR
ncbi:HAD family phosphatase [Candidatus Bipolaricaulota bacterium]|nr:HAD family phosphatase [Candidatus Bipolaricaulota bacterium]